jgi:8-oxo-dGTP pyrophosphatase MutT (NUDIX family)
MSASPQPKASGFVRHFKACNQHDFSRFVPLALGGTRYGFVSRELAEILPAATGLFTANKHRLALAERFDTFDTRSAALGQATQWIAAHYGKKLRDEMYAVVGDWGDEPAAQVDRAAVPWFGIRAWGVHVNGFVRKSDGIHLWIGERAADRPADPGKLDNLIGGGQPIGLSIEENLCKEAAEEAGIDPALALTATRSATIHYHLDRPDGMRRDTLFVYDLELPESFVPQNTDGEVASFRLLPLAEVATLVRDTDQFKFNCNLVIIDFMMRHGFISPAHEEYGELAGWLGN